MRTVTTPYLNRRKPISRAGEYPWSVTLRQNHLIETRTFIHRDEAEALTAKAAAAGFTLKEIS